MTAKDPLSIPGNSTIFLSEDVKNTKSPAYIDISGKATICVKGRGAILIESEKSYTVDGNNASIDQRKRSAKENGWAKKDYIDIDEWAVLEFDNPAFAYIRGDISIDIKGFAKLDKPSINIRYVELLKGASGLSIVTSLGALNYILVHCFGSGSYRDMLGPWFETIADLSIIFAIVFLGLLFTYSLWILLAEQFSYSEKKDYHLLDRFKKYGIWSLFAAGFLILAAAIAIYFENSNSDALMSIGLLIVIVYVLVFVVFDVIKEDYFEILALLVILAVAMTFWLNTYRDAVKAALVSDGEYCYWISKGNEIGLDVCSKFGKSYRFYRVDEQ